MKAICFYGKRDMRVEDVPEPQLVNPRDAILRITSTAICGSDLHMYHGHMMGLMRKGDIMGHEFMGEVVEIGSAVTNLKPGDRVLVPFNIACGNCFFCKSTLFSLCDNSNPNAVELEKVTGNSGSGLFGYTHLYGGYAGGQAQYVRVPYADVGCFQVPEGLRDEQVLFLTDIFPTGYMAAENCDIKPGDVVGIWGCGPVGQFAIRSAFLLGASRVIAIDCVPERLAMARDGGAVTVDFTECNVLDAVRELTGGRGPDACIDAVGMEAHGGGLYGSYEVLKHQLMLSTDRGISLRECIQACRKGGVVSIPGVYGGVLDKLNIGSAFAKALTFRMGQTHTHRYVKPLMEHVMRGAIDPTFVISHRASLDDGPAMYEEFSRKMHGCTKVILDPWAVRAQPAEELPEQRYDSVEVSA